MANIFTTIAYFLFKRRFLLFSFAMLMTSFFGFYATKIHFDFSPDTIFLEDDEAYQFYEKEYLPAFSHAGQWCMLAIEATNNQKLDALVQKISATLRNNPHVIEVMDAYTQPIFIPTEQGFTRLPTTNDKGELSTAAMAYFKEHPLYQGSFIGKDGRSMALTFLMKAEFTNQDEQNEAIESIDADLDAFRQESAIKLHLTGTPVIQHEMVKLLKSDQVRFLPFVAIFLVVLLFAMTKHLFGALFPLSVVFLAIVWTIGYLGLIGHDINVVNNALIMLIMVIGIADAVHIYTRYVNESIDARQNGKTPQKEEVIVKTLSAMLLPCFLTSATTALGFLSSAFAGIRIIELFGIDTAIGVMFCYVITFLTMPALLSWHKIPVSHAPSFMRKWPRFLTIDGILFSTISKSLRYAKLLSAVSVISLIAAVVIGKNITSNQNWTGELPPSNEVSVALNFIEKNFSPIMPFYIIFSGSPEQLSSRSTALAMTELVKKIRQHPIKPALRSLTDPINFLLEKNPQPLILNDIDDETYREILSGMEQFGQKEKFDVGEAFFSRDRKHIRILGFLPNVSTTEAETFRLFLLDTLKTYKLDGITLHATGPALISSQALHNLTRSMASSIGLALVLISLFVAVFFRSIRYMIIAVLPNILPIGLTIAAMYLFNIDVRLATVMIFSMALGLSIDACIHLLSRMEEERAKNYMSLNKISFMRAIYRAFHGSGRPIIYTTFILLGGFAIMFFSDFMALRDFSIIAAVTLLSALIADIVLLPALILISRKRS